MSVSKSREAFYTHKFDHTPALPPVGAGDFNVFCLADTMDGSAHAPYTHYDFFKIMLIQGGHRCHYADKSIAINAAHFFFSILLSLIGLSASKQILLDFFVFLRNHFS